jgi:hypothetical protein
MVNVELAAEPRTLVPLEREHPESYHRSVVIAFKTKDELKYFNETKNTCQLPCLHSSSIPTKGRRQEAVKSAGCSSATGSYG